MSGDRDPRDGAERVPGSCLQTIIAVAWFCLCVLFSACAHPVQDDPKGTRTPDEMQARRDAAEAERLRIEAEVNRRYEERLREEAARRQEEEAVRRHEEEVRSQELVATWTQMFPICEGKDVDSGEFYECCVSQLYALLEPLRLRLQTAETEAEREQILDAYTQVSAFLAEHERTKAKLEEEAQRAQREADQGRASEAQRRAELFVQDQQARAEEEARRLLLMQMILQRHLP